ncbi:MotA/TolQ/ExbB proton channel family protein [Methylophilus aquaticus]|uniref:MotA/TolQ/ExbB proton channel family protein n=1 Tax=Methylophilus aquaticus TaxID=1971610 RepID=A0ABT9JQS3_9PROT|nr:MotA/TolQ/ExbB proton channel family protein [Methylophilus aquaticus]MDP8566914.1 MotA/TolQ/ExbB proton channel family protein [Methylophilus aquaticus]
MVPDIVDVVLYFLGLLSVVVWSIIIMKAWAWIKADAGGKSFLQEWNAMRNLYELPAVLEHSESSFARLCRAGMTALNEALANAMLEKEERHEMVLLSLRQQAYLEHRRMDGGVAVLASIGSTAPFIGLFGTVWGIMNALKTITATGSAGLDVVAGPIGEALIATAIGIATAVPAVLAYNYFMRKQKTHHADMEQIATRFQALLTKSGVES